MCVPGRDVLSALAGNDWRRSRPEEVAMNLFPDLTRRRILRPNWRRAAMGAAIWGALLTPAAKAETIGGALSKAYLSNPDINQQRAAVRASDENIPKANAGYLPTVNAETDAGATSLQATGLGGAV